MLSKKNRCDRKTVEKAFKIGFFSGVEHITIKFFIDKEVKNPRISIVVPKGVSKKAVIRNRMRRRGYAVLARYVELLPVGFVGIIVFNKNSVNLFGLNQEKNKKTKANSILDNEIKTLFKKIKINLNEK